MLLSELHGSMLGSEGLERDKMVMMPKFSVMFGGLLALGASVVAIGCSSGSGSPVGGGSGHVGSCQSVCNKMMSLGCPNDNLESCVSQCEAEAADELAACPNEYGRALGCMERLPLVCGADGEAAIADEDAIYTECREEAVAIAACTACQSDIDDDPCDACSKQNCCNQRKAAYSDPAVFDLLECIENCQDATCYDACANEYPSLVSKAQALSDCQTAACGASCD